MSGVGEKGSDAVALFGEILVDEFLDRSVIGGAPFNVASHLRRFGLDPVLITRVGEDDEGAEGVVGSGRDLQPHPRCHLSVVVARIVLHRTAGVSGSLKPIDLVSFAGTMPP